MSKKGGKPGVMLYFDWLPALSLLSDQERGSLLYAAMLYAKDGQNPVIEDRFKVLWESMKDAIDRDTESYKIKCEQNRNNRSQRVRNDDSVVRP